VQGSLRWGCVKSNRGDVASPPNANLRVAVLKRIGRSGRKPTTRRHAQIPGPAPKPPRNSSDTSIATSAFGAPSRSKYWKSRPRSRQPGSDHSSRRPRPSIKSQTTRDAVHVALEHYVRSRDYSGVLALRGTGGVLEGYDPKAVSPQR